MGAARINGIGAKLNQTYARVSLRLSNDVAMTFPALGLRVTCYGKTLCKDESRRAYFSQVSGVVLPLVNTGPPITRYFRPAML